MKVFYTANANMTLNKPPIYKKTLKVLKEQVGSKELYSPEERAQVLVGEEEDDAKVTKAVLLKEKQLKESDVVIADITDGTAGVGYFISTALFLKKPTLVIQDKSKSDHQLHDSITAGKNKLLTYKTYSEDTIEKIVTKFLDDARKKLDTKFILIISPQIDRYLEWASGQRRMHKAQIVRNAVEDMMGKDKEWKKANSEGL